MLPATNKRFSRKVGNALTINNIRRSIFALSGQLLITARGECRYGVPRVSLRRGDTLNTP